MTRQTFRRYVIAIAAFYLSVIIAGGLAAYHAFYFDAFKSLLAPITALPATVLGAGFQRRLSFLHQLRSVWTGLLDAVQDSIQYTHLASPTQEQFASTQKKLSIAIDDFRSL